MPNVQQREETTGGGDDARNVILRSAELTLYVMPADKLAKYRQLSREEAVGYMFPSGKESQVLVKGADDKFYLVPTEDARTSSLPADEARRLGNIGEKFREDLGVAKTQGQVISVLTHAPVSASPLSQIKGGLLPNLPLLCQCGPIRAALLNAVQLG